MRSDRSAVTTPFDPQVASLQADYELRGRIRAEYIDMPGLNLTLLQASRLFGADPLACARALGALVRDGFLVSRGRAYLRAR